MTHSNGRQRPWRSRGFRLTMLGAGLLLAAAVSSSYKPPLSPTDFASMITDWRAEVRDCQFRETLTPPGAPMTMQRALCGSKAYIAFSGSGDKERAPAEWSVCAEFMADALKEDDFDAFFSRSERCYELAGY